MATAKKQSKNIEKFTQKQLKALVKQGIAKDITNADNKIKQELIKKEGRLVKIAYSFGTNGCNGMLLKGEKTGKLYAITSSSSAIYIF